MAAAGAARTLTRLQFKGRKDKANTPVVITTTGMLRAVAGNQFVLEADDHRIITYKAGDKMTVQQDGKPVELSQFRHGGSHFAWIPRPTTWVFSRLPESHSTCRGRITSANQASRTWDLPNLGSARAKPAAAKRGDDDDDRPTLRRGKDDDAAPQQKASASPAAAPAPVEPEPEALPTTLIRPNDPASGCR